MDKVIVIQDDSKLKTEYIIDLDNVVFIKSKEVEGDGYSVDLVIAMKSYETTIKVRTSKENYLEVYRPLHIFQINKRI